MSFERAVEKMYSFGIDKLSGINKIVIDGEEVKGVFSTDEKQEKNSHNSRLKGKLLIAKSVFANPGKPGSGDGKINKVTINDIVWTIYHFDSQDKDHWDIYLQKDTRVINR